MRSMVTMSSPLGVLRLCAEGDALAAVHLPGGDEPEAADATDPSPILALAATQLREYFAGTRREFTLRLAPRGTAFQVRVWRALASIPFGETRSYGALASALGQPSASRAVGAANGKNPLAIVVPCHRVIGASGALTGYGGGIAAKRWLLDHERGQPLLPTISR